MDRVNKIKNQNGSIEETINNEDNIEVIKQKLKDKENIPIKNQRLVFKFTNNNVDNEKNIN
tara:strand:+ start:16268 stop:16450 length:183 start_codon:yes stop_codon:yes gene_type:complete